MNTYIYIEKIIECSHLVYNRHVHPYVYHSTIQNSPAKWPSEDEQCNIILPDEENTSNYLQQHGWRQKVLCSVK